MGLYKRQKVWWMSFTCNGKRERRSTETSNKKEAEKIYCKVMTDVVEGKWFERLPGDEITFKQMMKKYMGEHSSRNKAPATHRRDKSLAYHLLKSFKGALITSIMPKHITAYKTKRRQQGASAQTLNLELALMRHAYNLAIREWEWVRENPVQRVAREKVNNIVQRWMTYEEEENLLNASPKWLQEMLILGIETGLRESEILNLRWPQVDLFRKTLTILEQKNKGTDTLPLNERAFEILKARAKVRHIKSDLVFHTHNGTRIIATNLLRAFYAATKKSRIKNLRWHDGTRHTFATRLVHGAVDIYTVQKLGRWKSISMVMRYAHHYPESLRPGIEVLDRQRKNFVTNLSQQEGRQETGNP